MIIKIRVARIRPKKSGQHVAPEYMEFIQPDPGNLLVDGFLDFQPVPGNKVDPQNSQYNKQQDLGEETA